MKKNVKKRFFYIYGLMCCQLVRRNPATTTPVRPTSTRQTATPSLFRPASDGRPRLPGSAASFDYSANLFV